MEVFVEYMVKKKKSPLDYLKVALLLLAGLFVVFILMNFILIQFIGTIVLLVIAGIVYLVYRLVTSINLEYEYILTNSDIDVDMIINARRRKRMTTVNLRSVECFAQKKSPEFNRFSNSQGIKKLFACRDAADDNTCFVVYTEGEQTKMLFFDPNEKIADRIKTLNPQKTFLS